MRSVSDGVESSRSDRTGLDGRDRLEECEYISPRGGISNPMGSAGLRTWTQRFVVGSALALAASLVAFEGAGRRAGVAIGLWGFLGPMVFGMGYLLLPPYLGTTLVDRRAAAAHLPLAFGGAALVAWNYGLDGPWWAMQAGAVLWSGGVALFLGSLAVTAGIVLRERGWGELRGRDHPQRSTRLASGTIPIALGSLVAATIGLLGVADLLAIGGASMPRIAHAFALGFGALLVYALGARLLIGFFHVEAPRPVVWTVLGAGVGAAALLGTRLWIQPWFRLGALLATVAMGGYLLTVAYVVVRTDRRPPGLAGIVLGAIAGVAAVVAVLPVALGGGDTTGIAVHVRLVVGGFFPLTVVGYAYLFFPVTGSVLGVDRRTLAAGTIAALAVGVGGQATGLLLANEALRVGGTLVSTAGVLGYAALLGARFVRG
jgi:hypothetical protein